MSTIALLEALGVDTAGMADDVLAHAWCTDRQAAHPLPIATVADSVWGVNRPRSPAAAEWVVTHIPTGAAVVVWPFTQSGEKHAASHATLVARLLARLIPAAGHADQPLVPGAPMPDWSARERGIWGHAYRLFGDVRSERADRDAAAYTLTPDEQAAFAETVEAMP